MNSEPWLLRKSVGLAVWALLAAVAVCGSLRAQQPAGKADASAAPPRPPAGLSSQTALPGDYLINPEDVLDIYVFDVPDISHEYTVTTAGMIDFPLLPEPLKASGLTPEQFAHSLEDDFRSSGRLRHPQITVAVKQSRHSTVVVEGSVRNPQVVSVIGKSKLLYVLSDAGGVADDAGDVVTVTRGELARRELSQPNKPAAPTVAVDVKSLIDGNHPDTNLDIFPGDRVTVEHGGLVYVLGEVGRPGGYVLRSREEKITVLQALTLAGDVSATAKKNKAMIIRPDPKAQGGREQIALNLHNILVGRSPDRSLEPNDILYIPGSGRKKAARAVGAAAATSGVAALATLAIYRP